tara:strand:- start:1766 stop:1969 length:204 start_codon:yes stop_codon:yes gene_type:complete
MGIGEKHAFSSQSVDVGGGYSRFRIVAGNVPITEVIGQNENDVGRFRGQAARKERDAKDRYEGFHLR